MSGLVLVVFCLTYLGMALGRVPGLAVDRTGIALLGITILIAAGAISFDDAAAAVDLPTIILLFALMILSGQFQGSGFYALCTRAVTGFADRPAALLAGLIALSGLLSAFLTNDVVVFALTPLICDAMQARRLDPRPYLIALAAAANAGSAATLIGNPQNILIGEVGQIDFWWYASITAPIAALSLVIVYLAIGATWSKAVSARPAIDMVPSAIEFDRFQIGKGLLALTLLVALFTTDIPREISALGVAGLMLLSRRTSSRALLKTVDWQLLILFISLFGITAAFSGTNLTADMMDRLIAQGWHLNQLSLLAPVSLILSNTIGNVPAVILLTSLPAALDQHALVALSLLSTLAGNLLLTGSIANIIVAERAASRGIHLGFADFARSGVPLTLLSFLLALAWLSFVV